MVQRRIAIVIASHNRRPLTLRFLSSLHTELRVSSIDSHIIVVDDLSIDGTAEAVQLEFPDVQIIQGDGTLYWAGSVRRAMVEIGTNLKDFDGIFLCNDDIEFVEGQLEVLVELAHQNSALVSGVILSRSGNIEASGGRSRLFFIPWQKILHPSTVAQECDFLPGHALYIPLEIYQHLGPFEPFFTHGFLDLEYSIRARRSGVRCLVAPGVTAYVDEVHNYQRDNRSMQLSLRDLWWRIRFHPKSPPIRETVFYLRRLCPISWPFWLIFYYRGWLPPFIRALVR
jgi:GT2 family glycosyltransferase